ncbi:hypothetical protein WEI85_36480 [Actinomycetes bacterium KLBMP 9797]
MSMIQELGARVRATSDDLPVGLVTVAVERLRLAGELLMWVRQTSADPMGVPQLAGALEHAEQAVQAVRVAQDALLAYLASIGLSHDGAAPPDGAWRAGLAVEGERPTAPDSAPPPPLGQWWSARVKELAGSDGEATDSPAAEGADLMRRVAAGVKSGDRDRLRRELAGVQPPVGLGLSALAPPVLHRLAGDLLRHQPQPDDLPQLRRDAAPRVRELLPGLPPPVLDTLLARLCRVPPSERDQPDGPPPHPADAAVAAGVLTGVLLTLLHREPDSLDPHAPEPVDPAETHA